MESVASGLLRVKDRIRATCDRIGRSPEDVLLVAVSKVHSAERIREAYACGQRAFGENYVQELVEKAEMVSDLPDICWHFIGHLQRKKAKQLVRLGVTIETVDSIRLAEEVSKRSLLEERSSEVLLQVNVAGEPQKSGCGVDEVSSMVEQIRMLEGLSLRGLMTIPPLVSDPEQSRPHFRRLRDLASEVGLEQLSMGMTSDLEVAIEEGATIVRVGTGVFGPRMKK